MLLVRFSFCECGSVVCKSPRPAQRSVLASSVPRLSVVKARVSKAKRSMAVAPYRGKGDHHNPCSAHRDRMPPRTCDPTPPLTSCSPNCADGMAADRCLADEEHRAVAQRGAAPAEIERVARAVAASRDRASRRAARIPRIAYPPELPVSARRDDIAAAMRAHQTIIVCGETGSGKTTQLPKICLELGRGMRGLIGHTQPRRIAARSVADADRAGARNTAGRDRRLQGALQRPDASDAYIKLMTDGILLAETQSDRVLAAYDTIIIDEAHERSLNIDFLLGYLQAAVAAAARSQADHHLGDARCRPLRPPFRRRDGERAGHRRRGTHVPGRGALPPLGAGEDPAGENEADDEEALEEAIVATAEDLWREGPGDILVFLPGEREIRETAELLSTQPRAAAVRLVDGDPAAVRAAVGRSSSNRCSRPAAVAASCLPPTSPRLRSPCPESVT